MSTIKSRTTAKPGNGRITITWDPVPDAMYYNLYFQTTKGVQIKFSELTRPIAGPEDFKSVIDLCTLCDMCFLTKCPYVPPHEFNLDIPHLFLRYRMAENAAGRGEGFFDKQLTETETRAGRDRRRGAAAEYSTKIFGTDSGEPEAGRVCGIAPGRRRRLPAGAAGKRDYRRRGAAVRRGGQEGQAFLERPFPRNVE